MWSDEISNEGLRAGSADSVWRSTREIFRTHAQEMGYQGDLQDANALNHWSALQTNRTLADSGDIADKVFEGNQVILEKSGDAFIVRVDAGSGAEPGVLPDKLDLGTESADQNVDNVVTVDSSTDASSTGMNEVWADKMGARFGLSPEEVNYVDAQTISTEINGHEVLIDTQNSTYSYFNDNADEVSGLLINDQGAAVNDIQDFLGDRFAPVQEFVGGPVNELPLDNKIPLASDLGADSSSEPVDPAANLNQEPAAVVDQALKGADQVDPTKSGASSAQERADLAREQMDSALAQKHLHDEQNTVGKALENMATREITLKDKVLLEYLHEHPVSVDKPINDVLSGDLGLLNDMSNPENSALLHLYDIRQAGDKIAQSDLIHQYINSILGSSFDGDATKLSQLEALAQVHALGVGTDTSGKINSLVLTAGDFSQEFDFSAKGLSEVIAFLKATL